MKCLSEMYLICGKETNWSGWLDCVNQPGIITVIVGQLLSQSKHTQKKITGICYKLHL